MRIALAFALLAAAALPAAAADTAQQSTMKTCAANWKSVPAADKAKTKYTDYMATCMKAQAAAKPKEVAAPAMAMKPMAMKAMAPGGGKAKCKDGTVVTYKSRSGTCSGHKGVDSWM